MSQCPSQKPVQIELTPEDIVYLENTFYYHPPKGDQPERYDRIRSALRAAAITVLTSCPKSRERSLALTALEQASMWANASIARNE